MQRQLDDEAARTVAAEVLTREVRRIFKDSDPKEIIERHLDGLSGADLEEVADLVDNATVNVSITFPGEEAEFSD